MGKMAHEDEFFFTEAHPISRAIIAPKVETGKEGSLMDRARKGLHDPMSAPKIWNP